MTFDALGIAGSALNVDRHWLDAISDNIANVNTAKPTNGPAFQARYLEVQEGRGLTGVYVTQEQLGDANGRMVYDPSNPIADAQGYVRMPDIDLGAQMSSLIIAQRAYQANAAVVDRARDTYLAALQIGHS